jgi:hypothetical protein
MLSNSSMLSVAQLLTSTRDNSESARVGMLNPSDVYAVRKGHIGMFFDGGGHIAVEELLAVSTTALTMHRGLNPARDSV